MMTLHEEQAAIGTRLDTLARGVCSALGPKWSWTTPEGCHHSSRHLSCPVPDGKPYEISMYKRWNSDMVDWSGVYVRIEGGWGPSDLPKVGTSMDRDPTTIARILRRQLFAAYEAKRAEAFEGNARITAERAAVREHADKIAAIMGESHRDSGSADATYTIYFHRDSETSGKIQLWYSSRVEMDLNLPYEMAEKVAAFVASLLPPKPAEDAD